MKRLAVRVRRILNGSPVLLEGLTEVARPIAVLVRKVRALAIAPLARQATEARVRRARVSPANVLALRPVRPFAILLWLQDPVGHAPVGPRAVEGPHLGRQRLKLPKRRAALRPARMIVALPQSLLTMKRARAGAARAPRRLTPPWLCPAPRVSRSAAKAD